MFFADFKGNFTLNQQEVTFVYVIFELLRVSKIFAYFLVVAVNLQLGGKEEDRVIHEVLQM